MRHLSCIVVLGALLSTMLLAAPGAYAGKRELTLYSKPITVKPYVGEQTGMPLRPNGTQAPATPGYITRIQADVVSKRSASARPLSIQDVMIHHLVYYARGITASGANCGGRFFARGEENQVFEQPKGYGVPNRTADGRAPAWTLVHMLMNHRAFAQTVYIRTRITYSDGPLKELQPLWLDTQGCDQDPVFDVPGGGHKGSNYRDEQTWRVPAGYSGRIVAAGGHLHGGGKYSRLSDDSCDGRTLITSRAYYGMPDHPFYRVRPILHEPGPIRMGIWTSRTGIPVSAGDRLRLTAVYDNSRIHSRVMSIMMAYLVKEPVKRCGKLPSDLRLINKPDRFRADPPAFHVPLVTRPSGSFRPVGSDPLGVRSFGITPWRVTARRGQTVTWRFGGPDLHDVTVANGPRGFSSHWLGPGGSFSYTPKVAGTYRIYCSLHPAQMTEEVRVK